MGRKGGGGKATKSQNKRLAGVTHQYAKLARKNSSEELLKAKKVVSGMGGGRDVIAGQIKNYVNAIKRLQGRG